MSRPGLRSGKKLSQNVSPKIKGRNKRGTQYDSVDESADDEDLSNSSKGEDTLDSSRSPSPEKYQQKAKGLYPDISREINALKKDYRDEKEEKESKKGNTKHKETSKERESKDECLVRDVFCCTLKYIITFIIAVIGIVVFVYYDKLNLPDGKKKMIEGSAPPQKVDHYKYFLANFDDLKESFKEQNKRSWLAIQAPLKRLLVEEDPVKPAVLLFIVSKNSSTTATCLAHKVVKAASIESQDSYINSAKVKQENYVQEKKVLDDRLKQILENDKQIGVVVDHIEELSPFSMLLFHGYCDGDNAPYKRKIIVLVMHTDEDESVLENENSVDDLLMSIWTKGLEEDKVAPLIARVANNKVLIKREHPTVINRNC